MSAIAAFMRSLRPPDPKSAEFKMYLQASPIASVSSDDAPFLLIHGDKISLCRSSTRRRWKRPCAARMSP